MPPPRPADFKVPRYWETDEFKAWRKAEDEYNRAVDALHRKYQLEVNHIVPAEGAHAEVSCIHHLDNLETLCGPCHREVTARQARERADRRNKRMPLLENAS